jgi:hypothetical protein
MSELPSALGIEAVEWTAEAGGSLTLSVIGRWRRRRPSWGGQPQLVIEAEGTRHRFPAMPEPPSLTGAAPGTWRLSFSVPASLAPHLGGRVWLQFGAVVVPLPTATGGPGGRESGGRESGGRESQSKPPPLPEAPERTADLRAEVQRLDRARRIAEQRAHAEHALRLDLEEELARLGSAGRTARALTEAEERITQLEDEVGFLRRRLARRTAGRERAAVIVAELAAVRRGVAVAPVARAAPPALPQGLLRAERLMVQQRLRRQPSLLAPLLRLRTELNALRAEIEHEGARRADAELRVTRAYDAIAALREGLGGGLDLASLSIPDHAEPPPGPDPAADPPLDAERFEVALARLREATPPREAQAAEAAPESDGEPRTWFGRLLRRLRNGAQSG